MDTRKKMQKRTDTFQRKISFVFVLLLICPGHSAVAQTTSARTVSNTMTTGEKFIENIESEINNIGTEQLISLLLNSLNLS